LLIDDDLLYNHTKKLSEYDFESQVGVNILGHIFENSLNEIESVNAEIEGTTFDKQKTKRKKDGVFYTPKYITKYIVDNTVGKLCDEKKVELGVVEEEYKKSRKGRNKDTIKKLKTNLDNYRKWLLQITILDPACGSGAFLNQALDFLIKEHQYIDELETALLGGGIIFQNIENTILENNIFGVDLNEESVEIAKLSLWLRTAQPRRKLNSLNNNIKCGNSLIDDPKIAGDKAFNWHKEFLHIFKEKDKKIFHITTATHDSRTSQRMIDHKVRLLRDNGTRPKAEGIWIDLDSELLIVKTIAEIVAKDKLNILAFNICGDHMHLLLVCNEDDVTKIVGKIKAITAKAYNLKKGITKSESDTTRGYVPLSKEKKKTYSSLWTQKFGNKPVKDENQLSNTIEYIRKNRSKHELPQHNTETKKWINEICTDLDTALKPEFEGGFDVVIGNPPYVRVQSLKEHYFEQTLYLESKYLSATGKYDLYALFMEKCYSIINDNGIVSFILPHKFLVADFGAGIRKFFTENKSVESILHFGSFIVFNDASTYTCIINLKKTNQNVKYFSLNPIKILEPFSFDKISYDDLGVDSWQLKSKLELALLDKIKSNTQLKDICKGIYQGLITTGDDIFMLEGEIKGEMFTGYSKALEKYVTIESSLLKEVLKGQDIKRYLPLKSNKYVIYPHKLNDKLKTVPVELNEMSSKYPLTEKYLLHFKDDLIAKKIRYKTNPKYWYSLHRSREIALFEQDYIITPQLQNNPSFTIKETDVYADAGGYLLLPKEEYDVKTLLPILNSKMMWYFIKNTSSEYGGGYFYFKTKYLEPFSIPTERLSNVDFSSKMTIQLTQTKEYFSISTKFTKYLQSQFKIEKLSKKLQNWHELAFGDFIKELNKAIIKSNKTRGHVPLPDTHTTGVPLPDTHTAGVPLPDTHTTGVPLPDTHTAGVPLPNAHTANVPLPAPMAKLTKIEEMEWMDVFETKKAEAQTLKAAIDKTDSEIDQMVYKLYELTEDEIEIIENATV